MKNKYLLPVVLLVAVLGFFYITRPKTTVNQVPVPTQNSSAYLTVNIDFGDNKITKDQPVNDSSTAFSVLADVTSSNSIKLETEQYDFGVFVKKIGEHESGAQKAWIYFINGQSGQVAADAAAVKAGDLVEWKYISPNE